MTETIHRNVKATHEEIAAFCQRWGVVELALFGSVVREDFGPESDVDVMIRFAPDAHRTLWDLVHMQDDLAAMLGRDVDIVESEQITNPYRRQSIERDLTVVYAA